MLLFQGWRCATTVTIILTAPPPETYVMSRAVTEEIVTRSHWLVAGFQNG